MNLITKFIYLAIFFISTLCAENNNANNKIFRTDGNIPYVDPSILLSPFKDGYVLKANKKHKASIVPYSYEDNQFLAYEVVKITPKIYNNKGDTNIPPPIIYGDQYEYGNIVPYDKTNWANNGVGLFIIDSNRDITLNYYLKGYKAVYNKNVDEYIKVNQYTSKNSFTHSGFSYAYIQLKLAYSTATALTPILAVVSYAYKYKGSTFYIYMNNKIYEGIFPYDYYKVIHMEEVLLKDFKSF